MGFRGWIVFLERKWSVVAVVVTTVNEGDWDGEKERERRRRERPGFYMRRDEGGSIRDFGASAVGTCFFVKLLRIVSAYHRIYTRQSLELSSQHDR